MDKRKKRLKAARRFIPLGRNDLLCCAQLICDLLAFYCRILCYFAGRMKKFCIEVTEVLRRSVEVEADSVAEALRRVRQAYRNGQIVLDASDYDRTEIGAKDEKTGR